MKTPVIAPPSNAQPKELLRYPENDGTRINKGLVVVALVGDFEPLFCHGTACIVRMMRDLILQLTKSSIYSTKPYAERRFLGFNNKTDRFIISILQRQLLNKTYSLIK